MSSLGQHAQDLRGNIIVDLREAAEALLLDTAPMGFGTEPVVAAFRGLLDAYVDLVRAKHSSSHVDYATRDLPKEERDQYHRARHAIELLEMRWPQEV